SDIFFFSSRRRHTRFSRDWSSDVCSSDLPNDCPQTESELGPRRSVRSGAARSQRPPASGLRARRQLLLRKHESRIHRPWEADARSEERRVGEALRTRWVKYI